MSDMRIGGLASGMDIDQIVSDLVKAEKTKVDKLEQEKQLQVWKQEMYNDLNKEFANFILDTKKDFGLATTTSSGTLLNKSINSLDWIKGATSSDETIATVDANTSAVRGSYEVNVQQLASSVYIASENSLNSNEDKTSLATQFNFLNSGDTVTFTITNGDGDTVTIDDVAENLTMDEIVSQINSANIGITAIYDEDIDRFFLQTDDTGKNAEISIEETGVNFMGNLGLVATYYDYTNPDDLIGTKTTAAVAVDGTTYQGADSVIDFAGAKNINNSSNQFTINGINFNLKATGTFTTQVSTDTDAVIEKISNFVEAYNELVDEVGGKLSEERYRDYQPLTEEQKEAMSEEEIELWEEKAKSGLLRNDMIISNVIQRVRSGFYEDVEGVTGSFDHLTEIGITTQKYSSGTVGGKLQIDEEKLREAIEQDVDGVVELLFKQPDSSITDEDEKRANSGLITRLYDDLIDGMKDVINKAGPGDDANLYRNVESTMLLDFVTEHGSISTLDEQIMDLEEEIEDMNDYLIQVEDRYWDQFTAMEKAIAQMNQQSAWLMSQFGGGMMA
ncbi:flagellar filament capping protein FliD [Caldisalinibacter kiritimatiensis]|uniref:Flagellar hook-associated protein 2 n=1 Tax=Caldisalinibacter kiritimatiensis TaxID=1304284 RepID=R1AUR1_9FIRM|nr:flagellar filament capping protein FliD [Caldisalinibacter kiritimatiensis]EOD00377.1 Flagellar hook-associated protein FliD [Caldisalinibacter kiritimatiensis]